MIIVIIHGVIGVKIAENDDFLLPLTSHFVQYVSCAIKTNK